MVDLVADSIKWQSLAGDQRQQAAQTDLAKASALAMNTESELKQRELDLDASFAEQLKNLNRGESAIPGGDAQIPGADKMSRSDIQRYYADAAMRGGASKRAQDALAAADKMDAAEQELENDKVDNRKKQLEMQLIEADLVHRFLGTAKNQSEVDHGFAMLLNNPDISDQTKQEIAQLPREYSPEIARYTADHAISAKDQAQNELTAQVRDQTDRKFFADERWRDRAEAMDQAKLDEQRRARALAEKNGKTASAPSDQELQSVAAAVRNQIAGYAQTRLTFSADSSMTQDEIAFSSGVQSVASRAKAIFKDNPAIEWQTAINRAIIESQQSGDWRSTKDREPVHAFNDRGKTVETAIPLPTLEGGLPDKSKMVKGRYYITPLGRRAWDGK